MFDGYLHRVQAYVGRDASFRPPLVHPPGKDGQQGIYRSSAQDGLSRPSCCLFDCLWHGCHGDSVVISPQAAVSPGILLERLSKHLGLPRGGIS